MPATDDYGLVVGIDDYEDPPIAKLEGAKRDAEEFGDWLMSPDGADIPRGNVEPFRKLSVADRSQPLLSHLTKFLADLRGRAPKGRKLIGRRLYVFLAGHGVSPNEMDECGLVTVDAGCVVDGYCSDCTRTFAVGEVDEYQRIEVPALEPARMSG